ncbi:MAG: hypothetical protein AAFX78_00310 [Cyanobacteria bacterium J06638_20]
MIYAIDSDTTVLPVIAIARFTRFLLTSNIGRLKIQRSRATETLSGLASSAPDAAKQTIAEGA